MFREFTHSQIDFAKYRHRHLAEAQYRITCRFDLAALVGSSAHACVRTAPYPEDWLRMLHPVTEIIVVYLGCLTHRF